MSRVYISNDTKLLMEKNLYAMRDCNVIFEAVDSIFRDMEAKGESFCDHEDPKNAGKMLQTTACVRAEERPYKNKDGEDKTFLNYRVFVNFQTPVGVTIAFNPKVFANKMTFGDMTMTIRREIDGKMDFVKEVNEKGEEVVKTITGAEDIKSVASVGELDDKKKAFLSFIDKLNSLTKITEKSVNSIKNSSFKPYYIGKDTQAILDGKGAAIYMPKELKDWYKASVDKMIPLAEKLAKLAEEKGATLKVEKESTRNEGETYTVDASYRIAVEPRMTTVKNDKGEVVKDANGKAELVTAMNENGAIIYNSTISVGTVVFDVDVSAEEASIVFVKDEMWVDKTPNFAFGVKQINEKSNEDVKAYVTAINDMLPAFVPNKDANREDSALWTLFESLRKDISENSAPLLDENGKPLKTEAGNDRKEEYATFAKAEGDFKASIELRSNVNKDVMVRIYEGKDGFTAQNIHFNGKGEKPNVIMLNKKSLDVVKSKVLQDALKKYVPRVEMEEKDNVER